VDGVSVLSFDRARDVPLAAEIVQEVLRGISGALDVVVVDLPRPDHGVFAALVPSVDAMVLLAGSGICDLVGASAIAEHLIQACPDVWLCLRTSGKGSHFGTPSREPWTCLFWQWSVRNRRWWRTCFTAYRQEAVPRRIGCRRRQRAGAVFPRSAAECLMRRLPVMRARIGEGTVPTSIWLRVLDEAVVPRGTSALCARR
jgi:hypothetical protein